MKKYTIVETNAEDYKRLIICLSYESLVSYMEIIEQELTKENVEGTVLVDQLFLTGNDIDRFMSISFSHGKFDADTAAVADPPRCCREETVAWLHDNYQYVEYSILTAKQRQKVKDNIAF